MSDNTELTRQVNRLQAEIDNLVKPEVPLAAGVRPLFSAFNSVTDTNVTGDGTAFTIICDTEVFDVNSNYDNTTGIFTAPVNGRYLLVAGVDGRDYGAGHTISQVNLVTSNRTYTLHYEDGSITSTPGNVLRRNGSVIADMDAADTASVQFTVFGSTLTIDVFGTGGAMQTYFQGFLLQ